MLKKIIVFCFVLMIALISNSLANQPYLILVSLDGFRWDYSSRGLSPNLDYIEANGVKAFSLKPAFPSYTFPNHQSIITGMHPQNHGIVANFFENTFTNEKYSLNNRTEVQNPIWYWGEAFWETARRHNIKTASYFWPGSELTAEYRRPDYYEIYEHKRPYSDRVKGVLDWLKLPYDKRPKFITLYFDDTDSQGHKFGTNSKELNNAIKNVDSQIGELISGLKELNLLDSTNLIVLSDHGMSDTDNNRIIDILKLLDGFEYKTQGNGPLMMIEPSIIDFEAVYLKLKQNEAKYKVYKKNDIPQYLNISNFPFLYSLVIVADIGWLVLGANSDYFLKNMAQHGWDNNHSDMHGIFYALGPSFKTKYQTGSLCVLDIYPLLCKLFKISPRSNIDGKLEKIEFILK